MNTGKPILVLDDDPRFRERLSRALESRGHRVLVADNLATALHLAGTNRLAAAVIDLRLPGESGLDLIPQLLAAHPSLPITVLTGFGSIATALEAVRLGARDYLTKPVEPERILAALRGERASPETAKDAPPEIPTLDRVEWEHIHRVLAGCDGNISHAARLLGIDRRSLQRKLAKYPPVR